MIRRKEQGQSLVEFALIVPVFMALMMGLFDGTRLLFTWNELQDAARVGARWATVNVNRDNWGSFATPGNSNGITYFANTNQSWGTSPVTSTIVGQVAHSLTGVPASKTIVYIDTFPPGTEYQYQNTHCYNETGSNVGSCSGMPVTVTVSYTFTPILAFGKINIPLRGRAVSYHE